METLKKQTNIGGDVKETDKYSWRRETLKLKKQTNIRGDVDKYWRRLRDTYWWTLKKRTNIGGDVKETDKYWWRR